MNKEFQTFKALETTLCINCGVPLKIHNTACGWQNANVIVYPQNEEEKLWHDLAMTSKPLYFTSNLYSNASIINCKSEEGVTISLIDSLMAVAKVINGRDLSHPQIQEAIKDLKSDVDIKSLTT